jgi:hypothetical protein
MTNWMSDAEQNKYPEMTEGSAQKKDADNRRQREIGGRKGPEPTRYGDWEKNGRCIDF